MTATTGTELAFEQRGAGAPTLLFVHGWTCNRSNWVHQIRHFAPHHRVVAPDLRGHGESAAPHAAYAIADSANDLACLIDALDLGRVVAVGHSMGALTVLELAVQHPGKVAAIALIDPAPFVRQSGLEPLLAPLLASIDAGQTDLREQFIRQMFLPGSDPALREEIARSMLATPARVAAAAMRGILAYDAIGAAARCKTPALHIAATPPLNEPHRMSEWLPGVVNGWTVGAGHFNMLEAPVQVNAMLEGFMRGYISATNS